MSSARGRLVSRSRLNADSTPARGRVRESEAPARQQHELPPYEPPSCPLSTAAKRKLDDLRTNRDAAKYNKHLKLAIATIPVAAAACNDRLSDRQEAVRKRANKRKHDGVEDADMPQDHIEAENYLKSFTKQVDSLTEKSEKALRELIDLGDEARMQDVILREVEENIPVAPAQPARRRREDDEDGEEDENEAPAADAEILSAVELIKKAKADYTSEYQSKTMRQRYGDSNDYKNFKRIVHDAQNHGEDAPPVPHASTWFPDEANSSASRRRRNNTTDNANNGDEDSDDEIVIESATTNLKCCLTLRYFEEPYSTNICPHTFEKTAIIEYYQSNGVVFGGDGVKRFKCPQSGCDKMLTIGDFHDDALMARKVKRALKSAAREDEEDDDAEDTAPRGTQRNRPEKIGSDDDDDDDDAMDIDQDEIRRRRLAKFKRESTRGLSTAPSHARAGPSETAYVEVMDMA